MNKYLIAFVFIIGYAVIVNGYNLSEIIGYVEDYDGSNMYITCAGVSHGYEDAVITIENAPIYDLRTGFNVGNNAITIGSSARAVFSPTGAEPFQALGVWLNWDAHDAAVFAVEVSRNVQQNFDSTVFISYDGKYRVTITPETVIICPQRGRLSHLDIFPGQELFVWVDMITASSPAEVYPDKVVLY